MFFTEVCEKIKNLIYSETNIKPKFIIFCKDNEKKYVYQCDPKEQKIKINNHIVTHNIYIQNTINVNYNIQDYTGAILVLEDDSEYIINKQFMLDNMFEDIRNSLNRKYKLTNILHIPVQIEIEYDKHGVKTKKTFIDKMKIGVVCGLFASAIFLCKYCISYLK